MILMPEVWRTLIDAGIEVVPVDSRHVELRQGHRSAQVLLQTSSRPLNPSDVRTIVARHQEPGLLVLPGATAEVRHTAERAGWSWLVIGPRGAHGVLRLADQAVTIGQQDSVEGQRRHGRPGPVPWGSLTVVRRLLERPAVTQKALAALAHVSQPRVSQTLRALADKQLVARSAAGWIVRDFDRLLLLWLDIYPGPGGISTYWYGLDSPRSQAQAVIRLLTKLANSSPALDHEPGASEREPSAVVSGDVAADIVAPWRSPTRAVIYARSGVDLTRVGLTPAGAEEATLELIVAQDPGVWPSELSSPFKGTSDDQKREPAEHGEPRIPLADPLQILWDVRRVPEPDTEEAVAELSEALREWAGRNQTVATS